MGRIALIAAGCLCAALTLTAGIVTVQAEDCDHEYVQVEQSATCVGTGARYYECTKCGDQYGFESTPALGHDYGAWQTVTEPSCESAGTERQECARCGESQTREIEATGHSYAASVVEPDCDSEGYTLYRCNSCGDSYKTDYTDALGHQFLEEIVEPTCTKDGYTLRTCQVCGDTEKTDYVAAAGHSHETEVVPPTCTKDGYTLHTCRVCGDTEKTDYVDATGHSYESEVIPPTCTKDGYTLHTCSVCAETEKTDPTEKTGHHYDEGVVTKEATTTAMGRITYTCYGCGDTYTETTPKLVNPFEDVSQSAYYFRPVLWAVERGITSGTDETHFSPNAPCTRAQVVTFLWRWQGSPEPEGTECPFVDVPEGCYYRKAVMWAAEQGITSGIDQTHFGSGAYCTRAQVVTFLYRVKGSPEWEAVDRFTDVSAGDYYHLSVCWASDNGITSGVDGDRFGPHQTCTRSQIVTFLYKADSVT